jgi:hypothetical protein
MSILSIVVLSLLHLLGIDQTARTVTALDGDPTLEECTSGGTGLPPQQCIDIVRQ